MRIIAGVAKGTPLRVPGSQTRPSTDRLREALFSILGQRVAGARVLDLFAGSGSLGLEALSRGSASCTFVDSQAAATACVNKNLTKARLEGGSSCKQEVFAFLRQGRARYDLIFADPPYQTSAEHIDYANKLLQKESGCAERLSPEGLLILEQQKSWQPEEEQLEEHWQLVQQRSYGNSALWFFELQESKA